MGCNNGGSCGAVIPTTWRTVCFSRLRSLFMGLIFLSWFVRGNLFCTGFYIFFTEIDFLDVMLMRMVVHMGKGLRNELVLIRLVFFENLILGSFMRVFFGEIKSCVMAENDVTFYLVST